MKLAKQDITVRSILVETKGRLSALQAHTRLTHGSLIDDAVDALWADYLADGHELPVLSPDEA